jgi:mannonate dehydratase
MGIRLSMGHVERLDDTVIAFARQLGLHGVQGVVPSFRECFLGEGNYDPAAVLGRLAASGFDGFIIDDHVPAMVGDPGTFGDISSAAYCSRGRAYAIGYLQGLLRALGIRE